MIFLKTWAAPTGESTTVDPALSQRRGMLWTGLVPLQFLNDVLLVCNVGLTALGSSSPETAVLAANLKIVEEMKDRTQRSAGSASNSCSDLK